MKLVVFSLDREVVTRLKSVAGNLARIRFVVGSGVDVTKREHLDALLLTLFEAERFGVSLPTELGVAKVHDASHDMRSKGLPTFIVASVRLRQTDARYSRQALHEFLRAAVAAVNQHNASDEHTILNVGVLAEDLQLRHLGVEVVLRELINLDRHLVSGAEFI